MHGTQAPQSPDQPRLQGSAPPTGGKHTRRRRRLRRIVIACVATITGFAAVGVTGLVWLLAATPSAADADTRVRAELAAHHAADPESPPPPMVAAAVTAVEDSRFYHHPGIDPAGALRALWGAVQGQDRGGATLELQLAKNLYTVGGHTISDHITQLGIALKLDRTYSKQRILEMYLASGYYGNGYYGLTDAAHGYFHADPGRLSWPQAALLAGVLNAPTADDPRTHPDQALQRRATVLHRLAATGVLTPADATTYANTPLQTTP